MSDSSTASNSKKPEETETKAAGDVEENTEPVKEQAETARRETETARGAETKMDSKEQDENKNGEEEVADDDEPLPPGFRNRGSLAYNSSGVTGPKNPGRPGG
ncbi:hypothetical protein PM082_004513 [Marasmius tenuissimus]|nr:hypothetical protein PM082_004513 [Marasmius tenuissimus]